MVILHSVPSPRPISHSHWTEVSYLQEWNEVEGEATCSSGSHAGSLLEKLRGPWGRSPAETQAGRPWCLGKVISSVRSRGRVGGRDCCLIEGPRLRKGN